MVSLIWPIRSRSARIAADTCVGPDQIAWLDEGAPDVGPDPNAWLDEGELVGPDQDAWLDQMRGSPEANKWTFRWWRSWLASLVLSR